MIDYEFSSKESWYVVQTKYKEEEIVYSSLKEKGIEVYLPRIESSIRHAGRIKLIYKPLFPMYIFAFFSPKYKIDKVRWSKGVVRILWESTKPTPIPENVILTIKSLEDEDGIIRRKMFKEKDRVRVLKGPLKGLEGVFDSWTSDKGRVMILLNILSSVTKVKMHYSFLEKL